MTLRQIWRFLRDCQIISSDCTIAQFNRVYNQGKKNHFTLLGAQDASKFDFLYGVSQKDKKDAAKKKAKGDDSSTEEDEEEEEENTEELHKKLGIEPDDIHFNQKVVLQRQFFEAIVRAAYVKYSNSQDLTTLSQKLDYMFKHNLAPMAGKNKAKTAEEDVSVSIASYHVMSVEKL